MIVVKVRDRDIKAAPMGPVTTGSVGLPVSWHFSKEWEDLAKTAVFRVGNDGTEITVAVLEDLCLVPDELLVQDNAGENLWIGVYGWEGEDDGEGNATIAMPTIWTYTRIQDGAQPSGIEPPEGTPGWSEQIQNATDEALRVAHGVAADADAGEFDGYSPVVTISEITHGHSVNITDREHQEEGHTFNVLDGESAYEQAVAGGYEGTEEQFAADLIAFPILSEQAKDSAKAAAESERKANESEELAAFSAGTAATSAETAMRSDRSAAESVARANDAALAANGSARDAEVYVQRASNISAHMPVISEDDTWKIWDVGTGAYVDTGRSSKGDKGDKGDSGVTTQVNAFFTMSVDSDGNLYVNYADGGTAPDFYYDSTSGNLYFVTED